MKIITNGWSCARNALLAMATLVAFCGPGITKSPAAKPNIIVFYTDDQGWADTSVEMLSGRPDSRSNIYNTPHLERLADEGMVFSNAYSSSPVCSPSRDSILYGMTPARLHHSVLIGKANRSRDAITTPRAIKQADSDYITAHFGKWACTPNTPEEAGFDESDGDTDNWHGDWRSVDGIRTPLPADNPKRMQSVTEKANAFIAKQAAAGKPFYMRISHYAVHVNHAAQQKTIDKYLSAGLDEPTAVYAAMIENLDSALGSVLDKLDALAISDDTYVIFTSDNGGGYRNNGPLRGGKASLWEGGIRVPTVVRGPNVPAKTYCDIPIAGWDLLPTAYDLAGGDKPLPEELDGGSLRPLFENGNRGAVERKVQPLIFYYPWYDSVPMSAIRQGDYKLVKDLNTNQTRLFNLVDDMGESLDLSEEYPELVHEMHATMNAYLADVQVEDLEELRRDRVTWLNNRISRDKDLLKQLEAQRAPLNDKEVRQELTEKVNEVKRRIENNYAAIKRVKSGRQLTAW